MTVPVAVSRLSWISMDDMPLLKLERPCASLRLLFVEVWIEIDHACSKSSLQSVEAIFVVNSSSRWSCLRNILSQVASLDIFRSNLEVPQKRTLEQKQVPSTTWEEFFLHRYSCTRRQLVFPECVCGWFCWNESNSPSPKHAGKLMLLRLLLQAKNPLWWCLDWVGHSSQTSCWILACTKFEFFWSTIHTPMEYS